MLKTISVFVTGMTLALASCGAAVANQRITDVVVYDHTKRVLADRPVTTTECYNVEVPIYGTTTRQGNAAEGALLGMIIGGLGGKAVSGNDKGAAAGAIIGGLVGADKGAKPKQKQVVTGYRTERVCEEIKIRSNKQWINIYSHSTIRFFINGKRYVLEFQK